MAWSQIYDPLDNPVHSTAFAALMGLLIMAQAYVYPFTSLVVHRRRSRGTRFAGIV